MEDGPYAILASVIRGIPPRDYRLRMAETLEHIHRNFASKMEKFEGDTSPFAATADELSRCLEFQYKEKEDGRTNVYALVVAGAVVLALGGWLSYRLWQDHNWGQFVETLRQQPGLVVTNFQRAHGHYVIRGMRDPLAADPQALLRNSGLDAGQSEMHWAGYYAMDDTILVQRARELLQPPASAKMSVTDGVLRVEGEASAAWVAALHDRALLVAGIRGVDMTQLSDTDQAEFARLQRLVQSAVIRFPLSSSTPVPGELDVLHKLGPEIKLLFAKAQMLHKNVLLDLVGHSDSSGVEATNKPLSQSRAERVLGELTREGINRKSLRGRGVAASEPLRPEENEEARQYNRSVTFSVVPPRRRRPPRKRSPCC